MNIKEFIEKGIEGGWENGKIAQRSMAILQNTRDAPLARAIGYCALLDTKAWQAVGKVEGWEDVIYVSGHLMDVSLLPNSWYGYMHRMIDALASGKSIEDFIATL